jgi:hypothetical protein
VSRRQKLAIFSIRNLPSVDARHACVSLEDGHEWRAGFSGGARTRRQSRSNVTGGLLGRNAAVIVAGREKHESKRNERTHCYFSEL